MSGRRGGGPATASGTSRASETSGRRSSAERERRLDVLEREARETGEVRGAGLQPPGAPFPRADAEHGYYGNPLLKAPKWTWEVPLYFFVGGAAGAGAVIGAAAGTAGGGGEEAQRLARDARWLAAVGGAASSALLVSDLGRPERFLHMLRVFKRQSPMSVGAWTLAAFSSASAAAAFADLVERHRPSLPVRVVRDAGATLSAATGLVMASYTGVLVGATAIPVWNRSIAILPIHFTASGLASAVALLETLGHDPPALHRLGLAAALVETGVGAWHELSDDPAFEPLKRGRSGWIVRTGGVLSGPLSAFLRLTGRRRAAAATALLGSLLTRFGWVAAGRASADDPRLPLELDRESERA